MKRLTSKWQILICFLFSISNISAQTITQDDFLKMLEKSHPLFEKEKMSTLIEKAEKDSYLGAEDWNIRSSVSLSHEEPAIAFSGPEKTNAFNFSGGVNRIFWKTGGRLDVSYSNSTAKIEPDYGFDMPFYNNQLAVTYVHPLLKNSKGFLDQLQYNLKQYDIDFNKVQAQENLENFMTVSADKFLDWVLLAEQKTIIEQRLKLSEEERDRSIRKREAHLIDQADVIRSENAVSLWKQNLVMVASQWKALQAELSILTQNEEMKNFSPQFALYNFESSLLSEMAKKQVEENSRILKTLNIRLKQLELAKKGFAETKRHDLSLVAQFNTKKLDESLRESLVLDKPDAILALQLSFPLGNTTAKAQITKTDLQHSQLKKQMEEIVLELSSASTNILIQLQELGTVLELNREQIESAKEQTTEELKLYNQGRGDLTFVIMSRDNEQNARLTYAQNAIVFHKLTIQYLSLTDRFYSQEEN